MRKDAEMHAAEDEKRHEEVEIRNKADGLAFQVEKTLKDAGDKIDAGKKAPVEAALKDLQETLMKAMEPVAQEMYSSAQQAGAAATGAGAPPPGAGTPPPGGDQPSGDGKKGGDDVVDADFTMK